MKKTDLGEGIIVEVNEKELNFRFIDFNENEIEVLKLDKNQIEKLELAIRDYKAMEYRGRIIY